MAVFTVWPACDRLSFQEGVHPAPQIQRPYARLRRVQWALMKSRRCALGQSCCSVGLPKATMIASSSMERKDGRLGFLRPVGSSATVWRCKPKRWIGCNVPLGDSLLLDPIALDEHSQAFLTIFYCSTDGLRHGGAAVQSLSRDASIESSNPRRGTDLTTLDGAMCAGYGGTLQAPLRTGNTGC
jgi:hypothetical protein